MNLANGTGEHAFQRYFEKAFDSLLYRPETHLSPQWEESRLCAGLRMWEVFETGNVEANSWKGFWKKRRAQAHPHHPDWLLSERPSVRKADSGLREESPELVEKAIRRVRKGMPKVFAKVFQHYKALKLASQADWAKGVVLTKELFERQLHAKPDIDGPEGLEASLFALTQWLEWFLSGGESREISFRTWRAEIDRTRKFGPAATRTFSTVLPLDKRLDRAEGVPEPLRLKAFQQLVRWMTKVVRDLETHLETGKPRKATALLDR